MTVEQIGDATLYTGDVLDILRSLPAESVHCIVTSPPYWGLRDYGIEPSVWPDGWEGAHGLEPTPELFVAHEVAIWREARRVLRADGTAWANLGDSFVGGGRGTGGEGTREGQRTESGRIVGPPTGKIPGLKPKDLVGIPWRVAFALQADGWYLRSDIIWHKPNPMPESVTDRPTKSHEYIFLLSKSAKYYYDAEAVREAVTGGTHSKGPHYHPMNKTVEMGRGIKNNESFTAATWEKVSARNKRSVWTVATAPFSDWTKTFQLFRVEADAPSGGKTHIVFPDCPEHADLARRLATRAYGEHAAGLLNDISRTDARLVRELLAGCAPTAPSHVSETTRQSWDLLARQCAQIASGHSNGTSRTDHAPETNSPCIAFAEMDGRIDDRLARLAWFALHASKPGSSIVPDGSAAHLLDGMISRTADTVSSSCCCQFYHTKTKETSHFATFPPDLIKPCILAGCPEHVCPKCGAPWVREVEREACEPARENYHGEGHVPAHRGGNGRPGGYYPEAPRTIGEHPTCACGSPAIGGTTMDIFGGSGTTAAVALEYGRRAILIERKPEYVELARRRIAPVAGRPLLDFVSPRDDPDPDLRREWDEFIRSGGIHGQ